MQCKMFQVFSDRGSDIQRLRPDLCRHVFDGPRAEVTWQSLGHQWPLPVVHVCDHNGADGSLGGVSVVRSGAQGEISRLDIRTGTLVVLHALRQKVVQYLCRMFIVH